MNAILHQPFDIETHKKTFINYLEVVILEDGRVEYAVPSHQEKLISIACRKLSVTRDELNDLCPVEYYFNFLSWLSMVSAAIPVWNHGYMGQPNEPQKKTLERLMAHGLLTMPANEEVSS